MPYLSSSHEGGLSVHAILDADRDMAVSVDIAGQRACLYMSAAEARVLAAELTATAAAVEEHQRDKGDQP